MFAGASLSCFPSRKGQGIRICLGKMRSLTVCCFAEWWWEWQRGFLSPRCLFLTPYRLASFTVSLVTLVKRTVDCSTCWVYCFFSCIPLQNKTKQSSVRDKAHLELGLKVEVLGKEEVGVEGRDGDVLQGQGAGEEKPQKGMSRDQTVAVMGRTVMESQDFIVWRKSIKVQPSCIMDKKTEHPRV